MTTIREDHDQQIASANAERNMARAKDALQRKIIDRRLKKDDLPGKTILKTYLVADTFVMMMDTGYHFAVEIDTNYGEYNSLEVFTIGPELALQLGVVTDAEFAEYLTLKNAWQTMNRDAREAEQIRRLISQMGVDKIREALG